MVNSNAKKKIALFGSGGHAKVILDLIEKQGVFEVTTIVDPFKTEKTFEGLPVVQALPQGLMMGLVAIGDNWLRSRVVKEIQSKNSDFQFVTIIHPSVQIGKNVQVGTGTVVMAGVCINSSTQIGDHCIINTRASVDHDGQIGDFASIAPGATLGGEVQVGAYSAIGLGASCIHGRKIGQQTVIGAGAVVVDDLGDLIIAYGNPCKKVRERKAGDRYL